jgi:CelD/BcsL family acetyltransferase involved in cellulose biosynthesis
MIRSDELDDNWPLQISRVVTRDAFRSQREEWNSLLERSDANSIFLTWEWISAWLDVVAPETELFTVLARDTHGELTGIAPFYLTRLRWLNWLKLRCLRVLGDWHTGAEYPWLILRQQREEAAIKAFVNTLMATQSHWDCIWLPKVASWVGSVDVFLRECRSVGLHVHQRLAPFAVVDLPGDYGEYLNRLSAKVKKNLRRESHHLMSAHQVNLIRCEDPIDLPRFLSALFHLHHKRWSKLGKPGAFAKRPRVRDFYERFSPAALDRQWLRVYALEVDGIVYAVQYGCAYNGVLYQLQEGFDPEFGTGLGGILRSLAIQDCIKAGLREYDFLGGFTEHKQRWGSRLRQGYDIFIGKRSLRNDALFIKAFWPTGRYLHDVRDE